MVLAPLALLLQLGAATEPAKVRTDLASLLEVSVVAIACNDLKWENVMGSGSMVAPDGQILTANHVTLDSARNPCTDLYGFRFNRVESDGRINSDAFRLSVEKRITERERDLALLRVVGKIPRPFPFLKVGGTRSIGNEVMTAGYPLVFKGRIFEFPFVRSGSVATLRCKTADGAPAMLLDMPSAPGFSGAPVVDLGTGELVGVMTRTPRRLNALASDSDFSIATVVDPMDLRLQSTGAK